MAEEYFVVIEEKLNLVPGMWAPLRVHVKQYDGDYTRQMKFTLYNGESIYTIPEGTKIVLCGTKRDGTGFSYVGTFLGSVVTVPLIRQMTAIAGTVPCEILLLDDNEDQIGSATFTLDVDRAALQNDTLQSSNDFQTLLSYLEGSKYYEQLAESYAVGATGIRDGENVDNSKFYSLKARSYALAGASYVGSPLTAATASAMSNTSRIYVYTGSESGYTYGNWYYYDTNANAWKNGGVYNSTADKNIICTTTSDMKDMTNLAAGMTVTTLGYDIENDNGEAMFIITNEPSGEANGMDIIAVGDVYAEMIQERSGINVKALGCNDATSDCTPYFERALELAVSTGYKVYIPAGEYHFTSQLQLFREHVIVEGAGYYTTKLIYNGDAITGDQYDAPFYINGFFATERICYDYKISGIQFISTVAVPAVLTINGPAYSVFDYICATPLAACSYGIWIGSVNQCHFNEIACSHNINSSLYAQTSYGLYFALGKRLSGADGPTSTNNQFSQIRAEGVVNGIYLANMDNSSFVNMAPEGNSERNMNIATTVQKCTFSGIGSEGSPSVYGIQLQGHQCTISHSYDVCGFILNGLANTLDSCMFDGMYINSDRHVITNCSYSNYGQQGVNYAQNEKPNVKFFNLHKQYDRTVRFHPFNRFSLTLTSNFYANNNDVPLLIFASTALESGDASMTLSDGQTSPVPIVGTPFVLPPGAALRCAKSGITFSYTPLNVQ